jgi:geranylgeranyl diphosphate synthase type I
VTQETPFRTYRASRLPAIETAISVEREQVLAAINEISPNVTPLAESLVAGLHGGGRLRATLTLLGYELTASKLDESILSVAALTELLQVGILAQDDWIDHATTRREKPTLAEVVGGGHRGFSHMITLSDTTFFRFFEGLSKLPFPATYVAPALAWGARTLVATTAGELLDIEHPHADIHSPDSALRMTEYKSAYYSVAGPLVLGALLAGMPESESTHLTEYGLALGTAYQLQDDLNDIYTDHPGAGNSLHSDLHEGKATLIASYVRAYAKPDDYTLFTEKYGHISHPDDVTLLRSIMERSGAVTHTREEIGRQQDRARHALTQIVTSSDEYRAILTDLVSVVARS